MTVEPGPILLLFACAAFSALLTWFSICYARRNALLDLPGQRRSHSVPTPRGGGIGIVVAVLVGLAVLGFERRSFFFGGSLMLAVAIVAAVGWMDDHRGLNARIRLLAHFVAVVVLYLPLLHAFVLIREVAPGGAGGPGPLSSAGYVVLVLAAAAFVLANAWFINLHNFMDGINGLLANQALFVFAVLAGVVAGDGRVFLGLCAAAVAGFLPFNFPRARVFMGDVGSGALGLLIAAAVVLQILSFRGSKFSGLIACSAFVTDATCTLLSRMLRGRRWYSPHREHLYQWLVRSGFSHARVVALYMGWNLFVVVPVLYAANRGATAWSPLGGFAWMLAVYALAFAAWIAGKRWCLRQAKNANRRKA